VRKILSFFVRPLKANFRCTGIMIFKRLTFAVYSIIALCIWWLIQHANSLSGWMLFLPILGAGLSLDYFIGRWEQRVQQRNQ
jgi:hypothetical protein